LGALVAFVVVAIPWLVKAAAASEPAAQPRLSVSVDPRVELVSIIFRLAGAEEYNMARIERYADDVDRHFSKYTNHEAVALAKKLRADRGISFNACMSVAVHMTEGRSPKPRPGVHGASTGLDYRWDAASASAFIESAGRFAADSGFDAFVKAHQGMYDTAVKRLEDLLQREAHLEWFDEFFGERAGASFHLAIGLLNGPASYAARYREAADGKEELYSVLGAWLTDDAGLPQFDESVLNTVIHEFTHSYANPVVERHGDLLAASGKIIFPHVRKIMELNAYPDWRRSFGRRSSAT